MTLAAPPTVAQNLSTTIEPALRLRHLSKRFQVRRGLLASLRRPRGGTWVNAVQDVSCDVQPGEFFGLLGPNGAGKTTLFKMLATLMKPDTGKVKIGAEGRPAAPSRSTRRATSPTRAPRPSMARM